jgi:hypothetical protein
MCLHKCYLQTRTTIENDFVQMRASDKTFDADKLHVLITLSQLIAVCKGKTTVFIEDWQRAKVLCEKGKESA